MKIAGKVSFQNGMVSIPFDRHIAGEHHADADLS